MPVDVKDTAQTENTDPLGSDLLRLIDDPNGSPATQKIYAGSLNLLPDGYMINGKLSVTVASNNLTVALKTKSGGNPSATDPVSVWINGSYRRCTAALSVTVNAGANSFNSGGSELATKEIDYFVYFVWNTTPGTDIIDIGVSRFPGGRLYSDFSGTATNEKYLAHANASAPAAGDDCVVIGRFAATLSAGAGYTWTVPTFTNANLIQRPIYETRWLDWQPVFSGAGSLTWTSVTTTLATYKISSDTLRFSLWVNGTLGGSANTTLYATAAFEAAQAASGLTVGSIEFSDGSAVPSGVGGIFLTAGTPDKLSFEKYNYSNWHTSGAGIVSGSGAYEI